MPHTTISASPSGVGPEVNAIRKESSRSLPAKIFRPLHLDLDDAVKERLRAERIYAEWRMTCEFQPQAKEWVIRAVESGGAVEDFGYYIGYCGLKGEPLKMSYPVETLAPNGLHAVVVAPSLVKVEMLRIRRSYQLMISRHVRTQRTRKDKNGQPKRWIMNYPVFLAVRGYLDLELFGKDKGLAGLVEPVFKSRLGEVVQPPGIFEAAVRTVTMGVNCTRCEKSHLLRSDCYRQDVEKVKYL